MNAMSRAKMGVPVGAGVAACVPSIVLTVVRLLWTSAPAKVPSHYEGNGAVNEYSSSSTLFLGCLIVSIIVALIALAMSLLARDMDPVKRAWALCGASVITSGASLVWIVFSLAAVQMDHGGTADVGAQFLLFLIAPAWGGLTLLLGWPFNSRRTRQASP